MANGWKIAFWIVFVLFLLETVFIGYAIYIGTSQIQNEDTCRSLCSIEGVSFSYVNNVCQCYNNSGQSVYSEVIK